MLCGDSLDCSDDCCYTIVYYESYDEGAYPNNYYSIQVTGIFKDGLDCDDCTKEEIMDIFYEKFYKWKASNNPPGFKDSLIDPQSGLDTTIQNLYSRGYCLGDSLYGCYEDSTRCCFKRKIIYFDEDGLVTDVVTTLDTLVEPPCPACNKTCDNYPYTDYPKFNCLTQCNSGIWKEKTDTVNTNCNGCRIKIKYLERKVEEQGCPEYEDYAILEIQKINCQNCDWTTRDYFRRAADYLIREVGNENLPVDSCKENKRIMTMSCWTLNPIDSTYHQCLDTFCCWAVYRVCRVNFPPFIIYTKLSSGSTGDSTVCSPIEACELVCDDYQPMIPSEYEDFNISINKEASWAVPNPTSGYIDFYFISDVIGKFELEIYDNLGTSIYKKEFSKNIRERIISVNLNPQSSGIYFYKFLDGKNILSEGKFIIKK